MVPDTFYTETFYNAKGDGRDPVSRKSAVGESYRNIRITDDLNGLICSLPEAVP